MKAVTRMCSIYCFRHYLMHIVGMKLKADNNGTY